MLWHASVPTNFNATQGETKLANEGSHHHGYSYEFATLNSYSGTFGLHKNNHYIDLVICFCI